MVFPSFFTTTVGTPLIFLTTISEPLSLIMVFEISSFSDMVGGAGGGGGGSGGKGGSGGAGGAGAITAIGGAGASGATWFDRLSCAYKLITEKQAAPKMIFFFINCFQAEMPHLGLSIKVPLLFSNKFLIAAIGRKQYPAGK